MAFDPHRHVTVASGAFSVDVNELNVAHAALTYEKLLAIEPSKAALTCAQLEVDLAPFDTSSVTSAHPVRSSASSDSPDSRRREATRARCGAPSFIGSRTWQITWGFPGCRRY